MDDHIKNRIMPIAYNRSLDIDLSEADIALLNTFPVDKVVPILRDIFEKENDLTVESRAYNAILALQDFDKVQFLLEMFERSSVDWQIAYCEDLSRFHDSRAIAKLCDILLGASEPDLRYAAAEALAEIGDSTAIPALEYARDHDTGEDFEGFPIADMAAEALQRIRSRTSRQ